MSLVISPSPTVWAFMQSDAFVNILEGPRGEGKTHGGYFRLLHRASALPRSALPLRVGAVRDTWTNLKRTTIANLEELQRDGLQVKWFEDKTEAILQSGLVHVYFMGLDRMEEINKLQGMGIGVLWIEEPAPAADISGGVPAEVFGVGATSLRQRGVEGWVQITMNPPDEDHWTLMVARRLEELAAKAGAPRRTVQVFRIPKGENAHYSAQSRLENRLALEAAGRHDLIARLVEGKVGQVMLGEAVMPEYHDERNVAAEPMLIHRELPLIRTWDFGLTPTCVWSQVTPRGFWHLLWGVQGVNMGVEQLIETQVKPWQAIYAWKHGAGVRDIGDPAGLTPDQSNSERSAALAIEELLDTSFEAGAVSWEDRKSCLKAVLSRSIRGEPMVQVDPEAMLIRRCLRGGWRYPKDNTGKILASIEAMKRASGLHDHVGHAITYAASVLFPLPEMLAKRRPKAEPTTRALPRSLAWMGS